MSTERAITVVLTRKQGEQWLVARHSGIEFAVTDAIRVALAVPPSQVGQGLSADLLDDDGPILLEVREAISDGMEAYGFRDEEGEEVLANNPAVEALGNDVSDRVKAVLRKLAASPEADETPQWSEVPPTGPGTMGRRPSGLLEKLEEEVERLREHARLEEQTAFAQQAHGNEIQWGRHTSLSTAHHTQANRLQALINSEGSSS